MPRCHPDASDAQLAGAVTPGRLRRRSSKNAAGAETAQPPLVDNEDPVDQDVRDALGVGVGLSERGAVANRRRVEDDEVGLHPGSHEAAIEQADARRREGCHLAHRPFQAQDALLPDVDAQHPGESTVAARVGRPLTEDRDPSVRRHHRERRGHDALHVLLGDRVEDADGTAVFDDFDGEVGRLLDGGLLSPLTQDRGQVLAVQGGVVSTGGHLETRGIAPAPFIADLANHLIPDASATRRIRETLGHPLPAPFERPRRKQSGREGRGRGGVGVLVDGHVDAPGSSRFDEAKRFGASSPAGPADDLVMGDLGGQVTFLSDRDRLADALQNARRLVAHVRDVDAPETASGPGQLHHFLGASEGTGDVEKTRAQPEGAVTHGLLDDCDHPGQLLSGREAIHPSEHSLAHGAMPDERGEVDGVSSSSMGSGESPSWPSKSVVTPWRT